MTPAERVAFTGIEGPDIVNKAEQALTIAEALIGAYCRGRHKRAGHLKPGVDAVLATVAARILENPSQIQVREQIGPYQHYKGNGFAGFSLVELAVLDRYRKRAI